jgi:DNA polymerase III gamma/tau subunit
VQLSLGLSESATLTNLYTALQSGDSQAGLDILKHLSQNGSDFRAFGHDFLGFLREQMLNQLGKAQLGFTLKCIEEFEVALQRLKTSPIIELPLEIAIINLTQTASLAQPLDKTSISPTQDKSPTQSAATPSPPKTPAPAPSTPPPVPPTNTSKSEDGFVFEGEAPATKKKAPELESQTPPQPKSDTPLPASGESLNAGNIKRQMENIAQKAGIAVFAKKSFLTATPSVDGSLITFNTSSEFHREKLDQTETKNSINKAIADMFGLEGFQVRIVKTGGSEPTNTTEQKASVDDFLNF